MSYYSFLIVIGTLIAYLASKYEVLREALSRRPTLHEVWTFEFEDNTHSRNARAAKALAFFFLFFGVLCLFFEPDFSVLINDERFVTRFLKMTCVLILGVNFYSRYIVYKENKLNSRNYSLPIIEIFHVFIKTGWFVKGGDCVAWIVNTTTVLLIMFLTILILY